MKTGVGRLLDLSAIGLSGLCLVHCLLLPVGALLLPALSAWTHSEWVHVVFVLIAAPLSAIALLQAGEHRAPLPILALATIGLVALAAGVFGWPSRNAEEVVTVIGSLCLAAAHLANWRRLAAETAQTHSHGPHRRP